MEPKRAVMSREALAAVSEAIREGHSVFCLEQLGVSHRVINLLYESGIKSVADLVSRSSEDILKIPNLGKAQLRTVLGALSRYEEIEDI